MNKSKKIAITLIIIFLVLLIGIGGAFAYVYLATDLLKSDQELFFKYLSQLTIKEDGFIDSNLEKFQQKKKQNIHQNTGEFKVATEFPDEIEGETKKVFDKVNELRIRFSGKSNPTILKSEQNIEIDYGNDVIFPINYRKDGDKFGLQTKFVGSKYIAVENNNLKEFAEKLEIADVELVPNKIKIKEKLEEFKLRPEEKEQVKQIYSNVINEQITPENFSRIETVEGMNYTLSLSGEQVKNITIKLLETFKQDTILLGKINKALEQMNSEEEFTGIGETEIQKTIDDVQNKDVSEFSDLKITVTQNNKKLNKIIVEYDKNIIAISKKYVDEKLSYKIEYQKSNEEGSKLNIDLNLLYSGLQNLDKVQESYEMGFVITDENSETLSYKYNFNNSTEFTEMVNIDGLNEENAIILNNHDKATIENLFTKIGKRLTEVNEMQMTKIGVKADQNPLVYSNPFSMMALISYESAQSIIGKAQKATVMNKEATVLDDINIAYNSLKTKIFVNKNTLTDYDATAHMDELVKELYKELGGTELQLPEGYTVEKDLNNNTITIKYEDENFGRGEYQPIIATISITKDNATITELKSQITSETNNQDNLENE